MHEMSHILARRGHGITFFDQLCRCPFYVILYESGGDRKLATDWKYGPRRAHRVYKRLGW